MCHNSINNLEKSVDHVIGLAIDNVKKTGTPAQIAETKKDCKCVKNALLTACLKSATKN